MDDFDHNCFSEGMGMVLHFFFALYVIFFMVVPDDLMSRALHLNNMANM